MFDLFSFRFFFVFTEHSLPGMHLSNERKAMKNEKKKNSKEKPLGECYGMR